MTMRRKYGTRHCWIALSLIIAVASMTMDSSPLLQGVSAEGSANVMARREFQTPAKREYDTHHYYALEIRKSHRENVHPRDAANFLGAELVDRVGELEDHWLVRSEKPFHVRGQKSNDVSASTSPGEVNVLHQRRHLPMEEDPVLRRWEAIVQARRAGVVTRRDSSSYVADAIRSLERQEVRRRHKRDVIYSPWDTPQYYPQARAPISGPGPNPYPDPLPRPPIVTEGIIAKAQKKFGINDPLFPEQWHLINDQRKNYDLNLSDVWAANITGKGVNICLIDDGVDFDSPDLKDNFFAAGSYDFNAHTALPKPRLSDDQHGTRCAGEIAAQKNDVCGIGVAYDAHVAGVRILSGPIADVDEAAALNYAYQDNHIYSCSWGPPDDGKSMDAPKGLIAKAILNGVQNGRGGKGSIYVFAGGNGGASDDQCNFDGYTNSIFSMTIAAVDREGLHPYYSEVCAATIASGWSSGSGDHIHTTDVAWNGKNRCTSTHGGTSAAAPLVAGVIALALEIRPDLTWRDVQHIAVHSAVQINPKDPDWYKTQAGRHYNHKFGYGIIDAHQFIEETRKHQLVKPQAWLESPNITVSKGETTISSKGVKSTFTIDQDMLDKANLESIEHVTVRVWIEHERRGNVAVALSSPHGTRSILAKARRYDEAKTGFPGWGFMTLKHWDESPVGEWTIEVSDNSASNTENGQKSEQKPKGDFHAWSLTLWGQAAVADKAVPWNFPEDSIEYHETLASAPPSTSVNKPPGQFAKPTDHLPPDHGTAPGESHHDITNGNLTQPEADTGYITGLKKNSTWLFAASGIVMIFAASLAVFFVLRARRRNALKDAEAYEFVPGQDDDDDDEAMHMRHLGGLPSSKRNRRTKELYDAFGEGSSDEDDNLAPGMDEHKALKGYQDDPEGSADERFKLDDDDADADHADARASSRRSQDRALLFDVDGDNDDELERNSSGNTSWQDVGKGSTT